MDPDTQTKSTELAPRFPTDRAVVRRLKESIAKSPKDIQRGQGVVLDRHGVAMGRSRFGRLLSTWKLGIYAMSFGGIALCLAGAWVPGSLLYVVGLSPAVLARYRGTTKLLAIDVIVRNGHLDAAQARLDVVPELRQRNPVMYCMVAGGLASHRGDHASAITWWREALPRSKGVNRELLKTRITGALLLTGRVEEARREYEAVSFPLGADEVLTRQNLTRVMFVLLDPSTKSSAEDLHDWARQALEYSHTGIDLAALGWAFERSGDDDMARFLATEAIDRMHYPYLKTWWPELQQWLDDHAANPE